MSDAARGRSRSNSRTPPLERYPPPEFLQKLEDELLEAMNLDKAFIVEEDDEEQFRSYLDEDERHLEAGTQQDMAGAAALGDHDSGGFTTGEDGAVLEGGEPETIYVFGDFHGDFRRFCGTLSGAGVATVPVAGVLLAHERTNIRWTAGQATVVFMGDAMDKGPKPYSILVAIWVLREKAEAVGGRVEFVLGNHELMRMQGDFSQAGSEDEFSYEQTQDRRVWTSYWLEKQENIKIKSCEQLAELERGDPHPLRGTSAPVCSAKSYAYREREDGLQCARTYHNAPWSAKHPNVMKVIHPRTSDIFSPPVSGITAHRSPTHITVNGASCPTRSVNGDVSCGSKSL